MSDTDSSEHFLSSRSVDRRLLPLLVVSIDEETHVTRDQGRVQGLDRLETINHIGGVHVLTAGRSQSVYQHYDITLR
jgi:hypothetical protein